MPLNNNKTSNNQLVRWLQWTNRHNTGLFRRLKKLKDNKSNPRQFKILRESNCKHFVRKWLWKIDGFVKASSGDCWRKTEWFKVNEDAVLPIVHSSVGAWVAHCWLPQPWYRGASTPLSSRLIFPPKKGPELEVLQTIPWTKVWQFLIEEQTLLKECQLFSFSRSGGYKSDQRGDRVPRHGEKVRLKIHKYL